MSASTIKNLPKSTVELEINIPWNEIKTSYDKIYAQVVKDAELPGFRKGKAPQKMVDQNINKTKLYEEVVKEVIPRAYHEEVQKHRIVPVIAPKVDVLKAKEGEEWIVKATIALKPQITLKNYKDKIAELKKSKVKIWTPGSGTKKEEDTKPKLDEMVKVLLEAVEIELSDLLINQEANRLLSDLVDQTQKLGLTVEQYLLAKGKTSDQIRAEYTVQATRNLSLEFILSEIADDENIIVSKEDIENLIAKAEKPEDREKLRKDSYYLAHLVRQQKTLDFLGNL